MSLSLNNSTIVPLTAGSAFLGQQYDNILDFAEINISIKCDVGYTLTYIYSQDKLSIDYQTSQVIVAQVDTKFFKLSVNDRYFKLKIEATNGNMSVLNVQTIYKSVPTFVDSESGPISNVNLDSINQSLLDNGGLKVSVVNANDIPIVGIVSVDNFPAVQSIQNDSLTSMSFNLNRLNVLDSDANTKLTNIYNIVNSRGQAQMIDGNVFTSVQLPNVKSCSFYGNVEGATILTLKFSADGVNFYSSQYSVNMSGAGNFGFVIDGLCAKWIMFSSSNVVNCIAFVDFC